MRSSTRACSRESRMPSPAIPSTTGRPSESRCSSRSRSASPTSCSTTSRSSGESSTSSASSRYIPGVASKPAEQLESVVILFAGDSGDGMQLTGGRFTSETAMLGNDLATYPDFPAEIRAPAGSLPGVSGFQLHFADHDILTPGDVPNVLVAMNPAALKTNLADLPPSGILVVDKDAFTDRNLQKAGYDGNPLEDGSLESYEVHAIPLTSMTIEALKEIEGITKREAERSKNMFALGLMSWLYGRKTERTIEYLRRKFAKRPEIAEANVKAFQTVSASGEPTEAFAVQYEVRPAALRPGLYPNITGNRRSRTA